MKIAIAYSTKDKTFCVTSVEIAQAMMFMGNEHGFNRIVIFPQSGVVQMRNAMLANGFSSI